jgi:ABC-2 type transport system ATP-binding protein
MRSFGINVGGIFPERLRKEVNMAEDLAIEITDLWKAYGDVQALRGVNLDVKRGEIFGFLGPNGAGKTTTIRCMLDLIRPWQGSIEIFNINPQKDPVSVRSRTGYLPGELNMESNLTVEGQLRYYKDLRGNKIDWDYTRKLAKRIDLDLKLKIKNLSKGNKQKVGVLQALMSRPQLLLMDEPTAGLDPLMQQEVYRLLREAQSEGATVFFSSHIIDEVETLADRVAIIREGVIAEEAEPDHLANLEIRNVRVRFIQPVDATALDDVEGVSVTSKTNGSSVYLRVEGEMDRLIKALAAYPVADLEIEHQSLEQVFLAYYETTAKEEV